MLLSICKCVVKHITKSILGFESLIFLDQTAISSGIDTWEIILIDKLLSSVYAFHESIHSNSSGYHKIKMVLQGVTLNMDFESKSLILTLSFFFNTNSDNSV